MYVTLLLYYILFLNVHYVIPCIDVIDIFYVRDESIWWTSVSLSHVCYSLNHDSVMILCHNIIYIIVWCSLWF